MLGLSKTLKAGLMATIRPAIGVAGAAGAAYFGVITPEMATGIFVGAYTGWIAAK